MTGLEFEKALEEFYGPGWRQDAAKELGVADTTIYRQTMKAEIDGPYAAWERRYREARDVRAAYRRPGRHGRPTWLAQQSPEKRMEISRKGVKARLAKQEDRADD